MPLRLTHGRAVALMLLVTLLWSIAGVVARQLEAARSFEVTFWRSLFCAAALLLALLVLRGPRLWTDVRHGGPALWVSGLCWMVMFTNFMVAIMLTTVATVLVTLAISPLLTALFARVFLHHRLPRRTWLAIGVAGLGIGWMFGQRAFSDAGSLTGALVALGVPLAAATNWTLLQHLQSRQAEARRLAPQAAPAVPDMLPAVLIGAALSALVTWPLSLPWAATAHDLQWLGFLGVVQLAIPCLLVVRLTRVLPAAEVSLLSLLEVVFGVLLAWLGAGELPVASTLQGGALVVGALLANEWAGLRSRRLPAALITSSPMTPPLPPAPPQPVPLQPQPAPAAQATPRAQISP